MNLNLSRLAHQYWALSSEQFSFLIPGIIDVPAEPVQHLEALNRGDSLVKALALVQVTYLVIQLVARQVAGLPSAQLEIGALAFSASRFITYVLYWNHPEGIESVHILKPKCAPSKGTIKIIAQRGPMFMWTNPRFDHNFEKLYDIAPIPNDGLQVAFQTVRSMPKLTGFSGNNTEMCILAIGALFGGTLFGGVHCLAWNFHFPTSKERVA